MILKNYFCEGNSVFMLKTSYSIGLMSGTSLDGVDIVYVKFTSDANYEYQILYAKTYQYSEKWIGLLKEAFKKDASQLVNLDIEFGGYLGRLLVEFIREYKIEKVDFIASHGHTIFHKPEEAYTLQIGSGKEISRM